MARRNGRPGSYLVTDDITGFTKYNTELRRDYWGNMTTVVLQRNLQEIAMPLNDPEPLSYYRGPNYEQTDGCIGEVAPAYVGMTTVPTNPNNAAFEALNLSPGIGEMSIGCSFIVR